jgi:hypothetical protein
MATTVTIEPRGSSRWQIRVRHEYNGEEATGEAILIQNDRPVLDSPPHRRLAEARAWLALGTRRIESGDGEGAAACAHRGLDALGTGGLPPSVAGGAAVSVYLAEDAVKHGQVVNGARLLLRSLRYRIRLYCEKYAESVA